MRHLVVTYEAAYPIEETPDLQSALQASLDSLRGEASARAISYEILENDEEYEEWYKSLERIQEVVVPSPTTITFD